MTRNLEIFTTVFALSLTALSPALAGDERAQLIAAAGLAPAQAEGLSLQELAVLKFNRDNRRDDAVVLVRPLPPSANDPALHARLVVAAGLSPTEAADMTLAEVVAYKVDRENTDDLHLSRAIEQPAIVDPVAQWQLVADAGLSAAEAQGMTLTDLAIIKNLRDTDDF